MNVEQVWRHIHRCHFLARAAFIKERRIKGHCFVFTINSRYISWCFPGVKDNLLKRCTNNSPPSEEIMMRPLIILLLTAESSLAQFTTENTPFCSAWSASFNVSCESHDWETIDCEVRKDGYDACRGCQVVFNHKRLGKHRFNGSRKNAYFDFWQKVIIHT